MSEPFFTPLRKMLFIGMGAGLVIVIVSVIALTGYLFSQYRADGADLRQSGASQVIINDPVMGTKGPLGFPFTVNTSAFGPHAYLSMELWVDGLLVEVQGDPSGGSTPLESSFTWSPETLGTHSLVVRGINVQGQAIYSTSTVVQAIVDGEAVLPAVDPESGEITDGVLPSGGQAAGGGAYIPPQPPGPPDSVAPGEDWSGSPSEWVARIMAQSAPVAPELAADAGNCTAILSVHDLSDNEEGFVIYRQVTGTPVWVPITTLASADGGWLSYTDENVVGGLLYYVTAFNGQGESSSNLALVNVEAGECADQIPRKTQITLEIANVIPTAGTSKNYCYRSLGGAGWDRWPQQDFLNSHNEPMLLSDVDGELVFETFDLMLECWGWAGDELVYLGDATFLGLDPHQPGSYQLDMDKLSVEVLVNSHDDLRIPIMIAYGVDNITGIDPTIDPKFDIDELPQINYDLVVPLLGIYDWESCMMNFYSGDICYLLPGMDYNTQKYFRIFAPTWHCGWNVGKAPWEVPPDDDKCSISFKQWGDYANSIGADIGFEVIEHNSIAFKTYYFGPDTPDLVAIPPLACEGDRLFKARLFIKTESSYQTSLWGKSEKIPCFSPYGPIAIKGIYEQFVKFDPIYIDVTMPAINVNFSYDHSKCAEYVPSIAKYCQPYEDYYLMFLYWEFPPSSCKGTELNDLDPSKCTSYEYWLYQVDLYGGQVGFEIFDQNSTGTQRYTVTGHFVNAWVVPPKSCEGLRTLFVRMFYQPANSNLATRYSWSSYLDYAPLCD